MSERRLELTEAEFDAMFPAASARRIAPGIWEDGDGHLHFSVPELLAMVDLPDTPEHRARVVAMMRRQLGGLASEVVIIDAKGDC